MTARISVTLGIVILALVVPRLALAVDSGKIVRLYQLDFEPPAGHTLAGVTDEATGRPLAIQKTAGGDYVCLVALDSATAAPSLRPVFAREDQRKDFTFLLPPNTSRGVRIRKSDGRLRISIRGKPFTEYHYLEVPRPFFYPLRDTNGLEMTRGYPMRDDRGDEEQDHPHHRSLWFTHGSVNGHDFWAETDKSGTIRHAGFGEIVSGPVFGSFRTKNDWIAKDGTVVCTDERVFTVYALPDARLFDYAITITASNGPVVFGDTKEGTMALRLAAPLRVQGKVAKAHITTSGGHSDGEAWGKRNAWVDYSGPIKDKTVGVAIFDHPSNLRHPPWWHARQYGLFAANPFGVHDFEHKPKRTGNHKLKAGERITFRYRFYIHAGDAEQARVGEMYKVWAGQR
ncbi:MAG: PmoA family protein [Planctomycetes bacterium]|nr:PmoA family protein [Planctomycetota bacterium]